MLNNIGPMGLILIAVVVLVLFGRGKISQLMGDVGKGITSFKKGMADGQAESEQDDEKKLESARDVTPPATETPAHSPVQTDTQVKEDRT